jgi:hypothetical protein
MAGIDIISGDKIADNAKEAVNKGISSLITGFIGSALSLFGEAAFWLTLIGPFLLYTEWGQAFLSTFLPLVLGEEKGNQVANWLLKDGTGLHDKGLAMLSGSIGDWIDSVAKEWGFGTPVKDATLRAVQNMNEKDFADLVGGPEIAKVFNSPSRREFLIVNKFDKDLLTKKVSDEEFPTLKVKVKALLNELNTDELAIVIKEAGKKTNAETDPKKKADQEKALNDNITKLLGDAELQALIGNKHPTLMQKLANNIKGQQAPETPPATVPAVPTPAAKTDTPTLAQTQQPVATKTDATAPVQSQQPAGPISSIIVNPAMLMDSTQRQTWLTQQAPIVAQFFANEKNIAATQKLVETLKDKNSTAAIAVLDGIITNGKLPEDSRVQKQQLDTLGTFVATPENRQAIGAYVASLDASVFPAESRERKILEALQVQYPAAGGKKDTGINLILTTLTDPVKRDLAMNKDKLSTVSLLPLLPLKPISEALTEAAKSPSTADLTSKAAEVPPAKLPETDPALAEAAKAAIPLNSTGVKNSKPTDCFQTLPLAYRSDVPANQALVCN